MTAALPSRRSPGLGPVSPARSPRLPSPPPFTEVQFGPSSPGIASGGGVQSEHALQDENDADATRRIRPGSRAVEMASGPPLVPLGDLDSAFQLQEHLKALYYAYTEPADVDHSVAITKETAVALATPPDGVDRSLWLYELCRLVTKEINTLILAFFSDNPPCSAVTCPEMRASEWQYLCAVHDPPKPCCAIDYCCHTLDWAANILTSTKTFPSRLTLGGDAGGGNATGLRNLQSVSRRLYRIFAHAWYQHRSMFWQVESQTGLYVFFKTICDMYQLIEDGNYTVPPEAEGIEEPSAVDHVPGPSLILKKGDEAEAEADEDGAKEVNAATTTARRHKSTLSTGSSFMTVQEEDEVDVEIGVDHADARPPEEEIQEHVKEKGKDEEEVERRQTASENEGESAATNSKGPSGKDGAAAETGAAKDKMETAREGGDAESTSTILSTEISTATPSALEHSAKQQGAEEPTIEGTAKIETEVKEDGELEVADDQGEARAQKTGDDEQEKERLGS